MSSESERIKANAQRHAEDECDAAVRDAARDARLRNMQAILEDSTPQDIGEYVAYLIRNLNRQHDAAIKAIQDEAATHDWTKGQLVTAKTRPKPTQAIVDLLEPIMDVVQTTGWLSSFHDCPDEGQSEQEPEGQEED